MFGAQAGGPRPQWQQAISQPGQRNGPPPAKKPKNNPIITYYAPPPGYRGPGQPPAPYQQPGWQQPPQPYAYGQPAYPGYPVQPSAPPPSFQQPYQQPYQQYQQPYAQPQYPGYPANAYPQQPYYPPQTHGFLSHPQNVWQPPVPTPQSVPPQSWQSAAPNAHIRRHNSVSYQYTGADSTDTHFKREENSSPPDATFMSPDANEPEDDYWSMSYYASHPHEIDPERSLGDITWYAPLPTKRPLPPTFAKAELEAIFPRKESPSDDEAISDYFINAKRHEALLSVRQTEAWEESKHDPIFKELPAYSPKLLTMSELLDKYKDRRNAEWSVRESTPSEADSEADVKIEPSSDTGGGAMEVEGRYTMDDTAESDGGSEEFGVQGGGEEVDVLGNLEQAVHRTNSIASGHHSRRVSMESSTSQHQNRPRALLPVRDSAQDKLLAELGVTGSPKVVYETPGPAFGALPAGFGERSAQSSRHNSMTSTYGARPVPPGFGKNGAQANRQNSLTNSYGMPGVPPPPPPPMRSMRERSNSYDPWRMNGASRSNGYHEQRRASNSSQHTAAGSDFNGSDQDKTPRPSMNRTDSRKRVFDDSDEGEANGRMRQEDDTTPKQRRKHPRVDDAYR
ncbi:hypothetical protein LTR37_010865 [Vermiconidia calcicola]|uniref:Uncharacterized protein n=1 Tax=Vermiconidia calcicola TaxID=1690605 RepID=A0ACC3N3P7_9PEZI|nr:hypothetical protein LTR37_010865 [Vermiconidia calcicola]